MRGTMRTILAFTTILATAACGSLDEEVGARVDGGTFGNATMNNSVAQINSAEATIMLGRRFAAEVPTTITFPFNSAQLTPEAQAVLNHQALWMSQFPELRFSVFGHTDLVGSSSYNKALGKRRAQAVVAYLGTRGISSRRLEALVSFGETRPVISTTAAEERNRRTVTEVSGFVGQRRNAPLNGKYAEVIHREYIDSARREIERPTQVQQLVFDTGSN